MYSLQTWLDRFKNICIRHRDQLVYGGFNVPANWWDKSLAGNERDTFVGQAAGDSATSSAELCLLCSLERLSNMEVQNVRLVAENDGVKRSMQDAAELVYQMEQRIAHREGRIPDPRITSSDSFIERLRLFDSAIARVMSEFDRGAETKQRLERLVADHENSIALLEQRLRDTFAGTVEIDGQLRHERDHTAAVTNELESAKVMIAKLDESLGQKSTDLEAAAIQFSQLKTEAKTRIRDLKSQLETKDQEYRNLSDAEAKLNMELIQANDLLATEKANFQQYKDTIQHDLDNNRQLVGTVADIDFAMASIV